MIAPNEASSMTEGLSQNIRRIQFKLIYPSIKLLAPRKFMKSIGLRVVGECRQFHFSSALVKEGSFMF